MTQFVAPPLTIPPDAIFYRCYCGHRVYDHGRLGKDGNQVWVGCRLCGCATFRASDGSLWPNTHSGPVPAEPTDLDRDTEAWVDGEVLLSHEREPDLGLPS